MDAVSMNHESFICDTMQQLTIELLQNNNMQKHRTSAAAEARLLHLTLQSDSDSQEVFEERQMKD